MNKHLSSEWYVKQGDVLSPFLSNFALEYAIRKVKENPERLELNGGHKLLVCVDYAYLLPESKCHEG
jgi:hypothetical protein